MHSCNPILLTSIYISVLCEVKEEVKISIIWLHQTENQNSLTLFEFYDSSRFQTRPNRWSVGFQTKACLKKNELKRGTILSTRGLSEI